MRKKIAAAAATALLASAPVAAEQGSSSPRKVDPRPVDLLGVHLETIRMEVMHRLAASKMQCATGIDRERRKVIVQVPDPKAAAEILKPLGLNKQLIFERRTAFPRSMPAPLR